MKETIISLLFFLWSFNSFSQNCSFPFSSDKIIATPYLCAPGNVYAKVEGKDLNGVLDQSDYQFEWRDGNNHVVSTNSFAEVDNVSSNTDLWVTTTDYNGCKSYAALVSIPYYSPSLSIPVSVSNGTYCYGGTPTTVTLSVTNVDPSVAYSWYCNGTPLSGNSEYSTASLYFQYNFNVGATSITVQNVTTGLSNFSLEARASKSTVCGTATGSSAGVVTMNRNPISINITPATLRADASSLDLTPKGTPAGGTWSGPGVTGNIFNPMTVNPGVYTPTYSITNNGCNFSSTGSITVLPACPSYSFPFSADKLIGTQQLCGTGNVYMKVQGKDINGTLDDSDYQFEWRGGNNNLLSSTSSVEIDNVSSSIIFQVIATDYNGCKSNPAVVTVPYYTPILSFNVGVNDGIYCDNGTPSPTTTLSVANVDASVAYSWYCNGTPLSGNNEYSTPSLYFQYNFNVGATSITVQNVTTNLSNFVLEARGQKSTVCGTASGSGTGQVNISHIHASITPMGSLEIFSYKTQNISAVFDPSYHYQWMKDGNSITGATQNIYQATTSGVYKVGISTIGSCSGSSGSLVLTINKAPVANAGPDQAVVLPANSITLNGAGTDPDGTIVGYSWNRISGPVSNMTGNGTANLGLSGLGVGTYIFGLTVTDNFGETSQEDQTTVTVDYPPNNYNYIRESDVQVSGKVSLSDLSGLPVEQKNVHTTYYDGLGRPMQTVSQQGSPLKADIVQPVVYDDFGRESTKYLPYVSSEVNGDYKVNAIPLQAAFYQSTALVTSDAAPYSTTIFESSPLNRVLKQGAPGSIWQPNSDPSMDHTMKMHYELNESTDVIYFIYDAVTGLVSSGSGGQPVYYDAHQLYAHRTTDEHGNDAIEYVNKLGQTICKKVQYKTDDQGKKVYASTYYIYNDLGDLVVVLPPEAIRNFDLK